MATKACPHAIMMQGATLSMDTKWKIGVLGSILKALMRSITQPERDPWFMWAISIFYMTPYHKWDACLPGKLPVHVDGAYGCR